MIKGRTYNLFIKRRGTMYNRLKFNVIIFSIRKKIKIKSERSHWSHSFHYSFHWIRMLMQQIHLETYKLIKPIIEQNHPTKRIHKKTKNTKNITYDEESIVQIRSLREAKQKYL